jgi:hypothetical protein
MVESAIGVALALAMGATVPIVFKKSTKKWLIIKN